MWRERRDDYNLKLVSKADIKIQRAFLEGWSVAQEDIYEILSPGKRHGEGFLPVLLRCFKRLQQPESLPQTQHADDQIC